MKLERLASIGVGLIGVRHAELVHAHDLCSLVGLCDVDPSRKAVADRFGVPFYGSVEELVEREQPSGVIIATSNATHADVAEPAPWRWLSPCRSRPAQENRSLCSDQADGEKIWTQINAEER